MINKQYILIVVDFFIFLGIPAKLRSRKLPNPGGLVL